MYWLVIDRMLQCSLLPGGWYAWSGGVLPPLGGFSLAGGCSPCWGFSLVPGGFFLVRGGFSLSGGGSPWSRGGLPGPRGGRGDSGDPPVNRITDTCKNITLATTSLRPVIKTRQIWKCNYGKTSTE